MSFDLKAARQMCIELSGRDKLPLPDRIDREERVLGWAPAALDEVERLQNREKWLLEDNEKRAVAQKEQANRIAELEADLEYYKSGFHSERGVHERVAAVLGTHDAPWVLAQRAKERIAELEVDNQRWREYNQQLYRANRKKHAALKKLGNAKRARGKALVEERAKRLVSNKAECGYRTPIKNRLIFKCDKGIICDWDQCPIKDEWREEAREQLRREGKI